MGTCPTPYAQSGQCCGSGCGDACCTWGLTCYGNHAPYHTGRCGSKGYRGGRRRGRMLEEMAPEKTDDQKTVAEMVEEQDLDVDGLDIDTESLKL